MSRPLPDDIRDLELLADRVDRMIVAEQGMLNHARLTKEWAEAAPRQGRFSPPSSLIDSADSAVARLFRMERTDLVYPYM